MNDFERPKALTRQNVNGNPGFPVNFGSAGIDSPFMMGTTKRRRRNLLSDPVESTRDFANYDVGLDVDEEDWPKVEGEDDFVFSVVNPKSYTAVQKFCQRPAEYVDASRGCNCSGEHVCLRLENKRVVATTSDPFTSADTFSMRSSADWCAKRDVSEVSGCSCEWQNTCDFVIYASPRMSISCGLCP